MNLPFQLNVESAFAIGLSIGLFVGAVCCSVALRSYKRTLQMVGKESGYEAINGNWYRITECSDTVVDLVEDMGIPKRVERK